MKFRKGDKVKLPIDKLTVFINNTWQNCLVKSDLPVGQDFLYVDSYRKEGVVVKANLHSIERYSIYKEEDLELYEEELRLREGMRFIRNVGMKSFDMRDNKVYTISKIEYGMVDVINEPSNYKNYYTYTHLLNFFKNGYYTLLDEKKIVGYKAPTDLFGGRVKKGQPFFRTVESPDIYGEYVDAPIYKLPKEIVETWEAIYKESERERTLLLGDKNESPIKVTIGKGYIKAEGKDFLFADIYRLYKSLQYDIEVNGYDIKVPFVKIGCTTFGVIELKEIIDVYNEINN